MLANTIDTRCYGEDVFRRHGKDTGGEQSKEKEERRRRVRLYIAEEGASSFASSRTRSPRRRQRVTMRGSGEEGRRQAARWRAGGGALLHFDFRNNYRIATAFILQITHKFSTEVENLQK